MKVSPIEHCLECDRVLVAREMAPDGVRVPIGADYICLHCHRSYEWVGDPPKIMPIAHLPKTRRVDVF